MYRLRHGPAVDRASIALVAVVGALLVDNLLTNRIVPSPLYVPTRMATAAVLIWLAVRLGGLSRRELGLLGARVPSGLRWGAGAAAVMAVVLVAGVLLPPTRDFFRDDRAAGLGISDLLYHVLVRIPLGTVLLEEIAFRSVLLGLARRRLSTPGAVMLSSALFGLWHILPASGLARINSGVAEAGVTSPAATIPAAVISTAVAGALFCWLRLRSGSVVATMIAHLSTNALAFTVAWLVQR